MPVPVVVIIGRANVGKSTLFNKLTQNRSAIVNGTPGVTRDRLYQRTEWSGQPVILVDTGGIDFDVTGDLENQVKQQAQVAQEEADCIVFVVDSQIGCTPQDLEVIHLVRKSGKPLFVAVNKVDHPSREKDLYDFYKMGTDRVFPISAEHGYGIIELMEALVEAMPKYEEEELPADVIRVAIVGKPNAGKSSIVNKLLNSDRCIVSPTPGTTRDAVDSRLTFNNREFVLIDTAGIRRKGKTRDLLEKFSVIMALKALDRCDIVVIVLDADEGVTEQVATIAGYAFERGRGCVLAANKWDLIAEPKKTFPEFVERVKDKLKFLEFAPVLSVSAKTGRGLDKLLPAVEKAYKEYSRKISTGRLNDCFERAIRKNPMSSYRGKFLKLFYTTQVKSRPPTFRCFVNFPEGLHFSYRRYLSNSLRKDFGFSGTPLRLFFTARNEGE